MKCKELQKNGRGNKRNGFLRVPNFLMDDFYSENPVKRSKASVYLCFLKHLYFVDGVIVVENRRISCRKGEWITTIRELEQKTGIPKTTIGRVLRRLEEEGDFEIRREGRFTFVRSLRMEEDTAAAAPKKATTPPGDVPAGGGSVERPNYQRFKD